MKADHHPIHYELQIFLNYILGDEEGEEEDQKQNLAPTCVALAILLVLVALCSNLIAFLLFYKKPVFRKILSNR